MTDCCTPQPQTQQRNQTALREDTVGRQNCPDCGRAGKAVDLQTVKALLAVSLDTLQSPTYHFCRTATCPVVYFVPDGTQTFREAEVRERVYQKASSDATVFVCYCFRVTVGTIRAQGADAEASAVVDRISRGIQAGHCACELRNPQGSCCLGNVRALVKQVTPTRSQSDHSV
jgi:hypothetical protein